MIPTPFEKTGQLTTRADETAFYEVLDASPRVRVEQIATSPGGYPVRLIGVGYPSAPPDPGTVDMKSMLVIGFQHGHEVCGREATIALARDLTYTTDRRELAYLAEHPVWIVPVANADQTPPDGIRYNSTGADLNRDHVSVTQPETKAIHDVMRRLRPQIVVDMHEGAGSGVDMAFGGALSPGTEPSIAALREFGFDYCQAIYRSTTMATFGWPDPTGEWALAPAAALRHSLGFLAETNQNPGQRTYAQRIAAHLLLHYGLRRFHTEHLDQITATIAAARQASISKGLAGEPFALSPTVTLDPAPLAYRLTDTERTALIEPLTRDAIFHAPDGAGGWLVPMGQPARTLIPYLMDEQSPVRKTTYGARVYEPAGLPVYVEPDPLPPYEPEVQVPVYGPPVRATSFGPVHLDGQDYEVTQASIYLNGRLVDLLP